MNCKAFQIHFVELLAVILVGCGRQVPFDSEPAASKSPAGVSRLDVIPLLHSDGELQELAERVRVGGSVALRSAYRERADRLRTRIQNLAVGRNPPATSALLMLTLGQSAGLSNRRTTYESSIIDGFLQNGASFVHRDGLVFPVTEGVKEFRQSHPDEFLYKLSCAGIKTSEAIYIGNDRFSVMDLLVASMLNTSPEKDLEWTIAAYSWYLRPNARWKNKFGETVIFEDLVRTLLERPSLWCGGSHKHISIVRVLQWAKAEDLSASLRQIMIDALRGESSRIIGTQLQSGSFAVQESGAEMGLNFLFTAHSLEWLLLVRSLIAVSEDSLEAAVRYVIDTAEVLCDEIERSTSSAEIRHHQVGVLAHVFSALNLVFPMLE